MNNSMLIAVILGLILIVGGAYYFMSGNESSEEGVSGNDTSDTAEESAFTGTMDDLLARGTNVTCNVSSSDPNAESSGVVYVSGNKMRGDFESVTASGSIKSSMIRDGEWIYTWTDAMPQGFKMKATAVSGNGNAGMEGSSYSPNQSYSYRCQSWNPDEGLFTPPRNISFMEAPSIPSIPTY